MMAVFLALYMLMQVSYTPVPDIIDGVHTVRYLRSLDFISRFQLFVNGYGRRWEEWTQSTPFFTVL